MSAEISVSVIVPAYRQARLIGGCLDSIARQTFTGFIETLVIDDGCPESSGDVAERHPLAPRVLRQKNAGVSSARNRGIREASGTHLAFLDADDRYHPQKIAQQVRALSRFGVGGAGLCFTRMRFIDEAGAPLDREPFPAAEFVPSPRALFERNFIGCSTVLVDKASVEAAGAFPDSPELRRGGQDYALWLRIAVRHPLVFVPEVLTDYMVHATSRVGVNPIRNFDGAVYALRAFREAESAPIETHAGRSYRRLVAIRARDLFATLRADRARPKAWLSAARTVVSALATG